MDVTIRRRVFLFSCGPREGSDMTITLGFRCSLVGYCSDLTCLLKFYGRKEISVEGPSRGLVAYVESNVRTEFHLYMACNMQVRGLRRCDGPSPGGGRSSGGRRGRERRRRPRQNRRKRETQATSARTVHQVLFLSKLSASEA